MGPIYLGVDGGGTKTLAVLVQDGVVLGQGLAGPSNHEAEGGLSQAVKAIQVAIYGALAQSSVTPDAISQAVLGLAGADFPEDFQLLTDGLQPLFGQVPFKVVNDAEVALAGGARSGTGIVVICGTGTNVWGLAPDGRSEHVGGNGYEFGDWGGGIDLARAVLHHAFRSHEQRGPKTQLELAVLEALGFADYAHLAHALRFRMEPYRFLALAPLCFRIADAGDVVAQKILTDMGHALGQSAVGCAKILNMTQEPVEIVMAGSVWLGSARQLVDAFLDTLKQSLPLADAHFPDLSPVAGAALLAAAMAGEDPLQLREAFRSVRVMQDAGD